MFFPLSKILGFLRHPFQLGDFHRPYRAVAVADALARAGRALAFATLDRARNPRHLARGQCIDDPARDRFPRWEATRGAPDGIIVLGGAISPDVSAARDEVGAQRGGRTAHCRGRSWRGAIRPPASCFRAGSGALIYDEGRRRPSRCVCSKLRHPARTYPAGGSLSQHGGESIFPRPSSNPSPANAGLLVTSAHHLPRRSASSEKWAFRSNHTRSIGAPVELATRCVRLRTLGDGAAAKRHRGREWVGLAVYWLPGRSSALFPGRQQGAADNRRGGPRPFTPPFTSRGQDACVARHDFVTASLRNRLAGHRFESRAV